MSNPSTENVNNMTSNVVNNQFSTIPHNQIDVSTQTSSMGERVMYPSTNTYIKSSPMFESLNYAGSSGQQIETSLLKNLGFPGRSDSRIPSNFSMNGSQSQSNNIFNNNTHNNNNNNINNIIKNKNH